MNQMTLILSLANGGEIAGRTQQSHVARDRDRFIGQAHVPLLPRQPEDAQAPFCLSCARVSHGAGAPQALREGRRAEAPPGEPSENEEEMMPFSLIGFVRLNV